MHYLPTSRQIGAICLFSMAAIAVIGSLAVGDAPTGKSKNTARHESAVTPIFAARVPAKNPTDLVVSADHEKVLGWVTGTKDFAGEKVTISVGDKTHTTIVQHDNTFTWHYHISKPTVATFQIADMQRSEKLRPAVAGGDTVFFVVDRTVYRPRQTLRFAAFLRRENDRRDFVPLADREVEVRLTSVKKNTVAAKIKATSDSFGRVVGQYDFQDADALDTYKLSIPGFTGSGQVRLAEFRKAKVRLKIDSKLDGRDLQLTFQAVDFLDNPVEGTQVDFTAKVVHATVAAEEEALDPTKFAYPNHIVAGQPQLKGLDDDARLLWEAGLTSGGFVAAAATSVVAQRQGRVEVGEQGRGQHTLALEPAWTKGNYRVVVEGVLIDYNGREQRATRILPIGDKVNDCDLTLHLAKRHFGTGEEITVVMEPLDKDAQPINVTATVMAMRLSPAPPQQFATPFYGYRYGFYGYRNYMPYWHRAAWNPGGRRSPRWQTARAAEAGQPRRTLETAAVARDNVATFQLDQPGPYKLVCIAELPDGRKLKNEIGCIVRRPQEMPGLVLELDDDELATGDQLTGTIHSRYADARVLLTLRDSRGARLWRTYTLQKGVARIRERLPAGLKYGCSVEIQYLEAVDSMYVATRDILVEPVGRIIQIDAKTGEVYAPGDEVTLDVDINRNEEVDLVVSVYDQSLLAVAADRSTDIRHFFLADQRVFESSAHEVLRRRLGGVTVRELVESAEKMLKEDHKLQHTPHGTQLQQAINYYRNSRYINHWTLQTLLALADVDGIHVSPYAHVYGGNWYYQFNAEQEKKKPIRLHELLGHDRNGWRITARLSGDTLVLTESHPRQQPIRGHALLGNQIFLNGSGYGMRAARGDAHFSVSANGMFSDLGGALSGQAFISHLPGPAAAVQLLEADATDVSVRRDFSDLAFWNSQLRTDRRGRAQVKFKLPDSLTNWQVVVTAVSRDMHVGQTKTRFRTFKPVMVWPMVPRLFTEGDRVQLYASVHNRTDKPQEMQVSLKVKNGVIHSPRTVTVTVPAKDNVPVYWTYEPSESGYAQLLMTATCNAGSDASLKRLPVARMAVEQAVTLSGFAKKGATLVVPSDADLDDAELEITFVPTLLDDLVQSLDYLVQYPHGCVEQTMSRFLPAIKVAQTLERAKIENKPLQEKLPGVVEAGIKRLLELQREDGGWGWHSGSATHEMMTPYALYGLLQAEKAGYPIPNEQAVQRGIKRLVQFIGSMNEKQAADRIYCMYVYSHRHALINDYWKFIELQAANPSLSDYALAMSLEMAVAAEKDQLAGRLAAALHRNAQRTPGTAFWTQAGFSRWGNDRFEVTAAVLKALVAHNSEDELIAPTLSFFATTKRGKRWNSTKDTAMIIYAMCDYLATQDYQAGGRRMVELTVNDAPPQVVKLTGGLQPTITIPGASLRKGNNSLRFDGHVPGAMFRAVFRYWQRREQITPLASGLEVRRQYFLLDSDAKRVRELVPGDTVPRGAYLESVVTVTRQAGQSMRYVLVENPKPSTCEILPASDRRYPQDSTTYALREDKTAGVFFHHEQTGAKIVDRCVLHTELAGTFLVPPAKVELMYETLTRGHSGAFHFTVENAESKVALRR